MKAVNRTCTSEGTTEDVCGIVLPHMYATATTDAGLTPLPLSKETTKKEGPCMSARGAGCAKATTAGERATGASAKTGARCRAAGCVRAGMEGDCIMGAAF